MRLLIGILYCLEQEYQDCLQAIQQQTYTDWQLFSIENLPNKKAHHRLYQTFMERAKEADLFVKIDADMVLDRPTFLAELVVEAQRYPAVQHFQIGVWDHFTDRIIHALHAYRSTSRWVENNEHYFVDQGDETLLTKSYLDPRGALCPAAQHCPSPSPFQAFHFGVHKAVKITQHSRAQKDLTMARGHADNILGLFRHYRSKPSLTLRLAILGATWALRSKASHQAVNFDNPQTEAAFATAHKLLPAEQAQQIQEARRNWLIDYPLLIGQSYLVYRFTWGLTPIVAFLKAWGYGIYCKFKFISKGRR